MRGSFLVDECDDTDELKAADDACAAVYESIDVGGVCALDTVELVRACALLGLHFPDSMRGVGQHDRAPHAMLHFLRKKDGDRVSLDELRALWRSYLKWKSATLEEARARRVPQPWLPTSVGASEPHRVLRAAFLLLDDPASCVVARIIAAADLLCIMLSISTLILGTLESYQTWTGGKRGSGVVEMIPGFEAVEVICVAVFTTQYLARVLLVGFTSRHAGSCVSLRLSIRL